jgi:hypothetical protein
MPAGVIVAWKLNPPCTEGNPMVYSRPMVPQTFAVPERVEGDGLFLRMLSVHDVIRDFDAVMATSAHLLGFMEPGSRWPQGLTVEENLIDLAWHHREFTLRHSFAYTVLEPTGERCLGCAYLYPSDRAGFDGMAFYWARAFDADLDRRLGAAFRGALSSWPLRKIAFPGRDIPWADWQARPQAHT